MSEPDWMTELRDWVDVWIGGSDRTQEGALRTLKPHLDAAYHRGLIAGRSQAGYTTRRKREEDPCPAPVPSAAGPTRALTTEAGEVT